MPLILNDSHLERLIHLENVCYDGDGDSGGGGGGNVGGGVCSSACLSIALCQSLYYITKLFTSW